MRVAWNGTDDAAYPRKTSLLITDGGDPIPSEDFPEMARWALEGLLLHHRTGRMQPGDPIVLVAAAARHRRDAFEAADFAMDHLKSDAWFWKREKRAGEWHWVEPRAEDHHDLARWT